MSNGQRSRMFSFSRKCDLIHYESCLILNFVLLFHTLTNVATLQTTLNLQDSFTELASNQLTNQLSNQISNQFSNQLPNQLTNQLSNQLNDQYSQSAASLNNQTDLDSLQNSIEHNLMNNNNNDQFKKSNDQASNAPILPNFQDHQSNIWSLRLDKPIQQNSNLDYSNPSTLLPASLNPSLSSPFISSQTISNSLSNSLHSSSPSSMSSLSTLQSPRPFNNENPTNFNSNYSPNNIYNNENGPNMNHNMNHNLNPNLNTLSSNNNLNHNMKHNLNTNAFNNHQMNHPMNQQSNQNVLGRPVNAYKKTASDINSINHNLFGNAFISLANLPSTSKLRINTDTDMLNFKKKNAFQARKNFRSKDSNSLPNFLLATNKRNIPTAGNWPIGSSVNAKLNTNDDVFKTDYPMNKFIPNRMQTDDYEDSGDEDLKNNNANLNGNNFQSSNPNDSGDEENFSEAFNSGNNDLDSPIATNNESSNKKKTLNSVDPMNLLLYNKLNQLNSADSTGTSTGKNKLLNANFASSNANSNQPYYVILPQMPTNSLNSLDDIFDTGLDSNPPIHPQQKRRKSTAKPAKLSWWQRLLPERLRPQTNANTASGEATSSEENQSNESSRYKDTKFKNSYLKAPDTGDLFTEVYGTGLQPNVPLPVFQPMSQLYQTLPYQNAGTNYHNGAVLGLSGSSGSPLFGHTGLGDGEPSEEEAAAEEDAEEEEAHNNANSTFGDRMKNWFKNIFGKSSPGSNTNNQPENARKSSASKISPKILMI